MPALRLAESAGLHDLLDVGRASVRPNATAKTTSVVGGMLAGADSIDDLDLLQHGGCPGCSPVRAPSTLGTFLRSFAHGHVQQLDAVAGRLQAGLTQQIREPTVAGQHSAGADPASRRPTTFRTHLQVSATAVLWRATNSAIGSATAAGSVLTEK